MTSDYVVVPREATEEMLHSARPMPLDQLDGIWQAMVSAAPSPWKPISEAPKDGTDILVWGGPNADPIWGVAYWDAGDVGISPGWMIWNSRNQFPHEWPEFWMPLPAPPSNPT